MPRTTSQLGHEPLGDSGEALPKAWMPPEPSTV